MKRTINVSFQLTLDSFIMYIYDKRRGLVESEKGTVAFI